MNSLFFVNYDLYEYTRMYIESFKEGKYIARDHLSNILKTLNTEILV